jgi:uncharacterized protein (TIGR03435 family)
MTRIISIVILVNLTAATPSLIAQDRTAAAGSPEFVSTSVRAGTSEGRRGMNLQSGRVTWTNVTLRDLIETAYQSTGFARVSVRGGPSWVDSLRFDVVGDAGGRALMDADGAPRPLFAMLRALLVKEFKLNAHIETEQVPAYALVMSRIDREKGPRLKTSPPDCVGPMCGGLGPYPRRLVATAVTMAQFSRFLSGVVDRVVVDRTGLSGPFDVEVEAVEIRQPGPPGPSTRPSDTTQSIFDALPSQLGLRLEATQAPAGTIVIDSAEQPALR